MTSYGSVVLVGIVAYRRDKYIVSFSQAIELRQKNLREIINDVDNHPCYGLKPLQLWSPNVLL